MSTGRRCQPHYVEHTNQLCKKATFINIGYINRILQIYLTPTSPTLYSGECLSKLLAHDIFFWI